MKRFTANRLFVALFLLVAFPLTARATNPVEWILRTNGWGWSDGYHTKNGCVKTGPLPRSYFPVVGESMPAWEHPASTVAPHTHSYSSAPAASTPSYGGYPTTYPQPNYGMPSNATRRETTPNLAPPPIPRSTDYESLPTTPKKLPPIPGMEEDARRPGYYPRSANVPPHNQHNIYPSYPATASRPPAIRP